MNRILLALTLAVALVSSAIAGPIYSDRSEVYDALVKTTYYVDNSNIYSGSAVAIGPHMLLTAKHVIAFNDKTKKAGEYLQVFDKYDLKKYNVLPVYISKDDDYAILYTKDELEYWMPVKDKNLTLPMYSKVYVGGFPLGHDFMITEGHYFGLSDIKAPQGRFVDKISAEVVFGNSGGPCIFWNKSNNRWELIGLSEAVEAFPDGLGHIIPHLALITPVRAMDKLYEDAEHYIGWD